MLDLAIILGFVFYAIGSGLRARQKAGQNLDEYFLAGRSVAGWKAGFSMAATQFAADTPLLVVGLIATGGVFLLWRLWIYGVAFLLMGFVLAGSWRRSGVLTDAELTEIRYSGPGVVWLRGLKAVYYGTLINCVVLAMVLVAAMRIAEVFLPWHQWLPEAVYTVPYGIVRWVGVPLGGSVTGLEPMVLTTNNLLSLGVIVAFTALYSTTGGLRSVIATDVAQFSLGLIGTAAYAWLLSDAAGGLGGLADRLGELYGQAQATDMLRFVPPADELVTGFAIVIGLQWLFQMNADGTGYLAQRSMACRSDHDARVAASVFTWLQIVVRSLVWLVIGVSLLVLFPFDPAAAGGDDFAASREILFVTGIDQVMPPGARGLMLVGLLAALASTIDTHINWGASYWSHDLYDRIVCREWLERDPDDRELVWVARAATLVILALAFAIMAQLDSIQQAWQISLTFGAGMGSVLVLRWLWERINLFSEAAAMAVSVVAAPLLVVYAEQAWIQLGTMALLSTGAAVAITFVTRDTDHAVLDAFYRRVRPQGLWDRTARRTGVDHAHRVRLWRGLGFTVAGALSAFSALVGAGILLLSPPGRSPWLGATLLVAAALLVPIWWRGLHPPKAHADVAQEPKNDIKTTK